MANSHQADREDLKQDKDLWVVHRQEQGLSPTLAMEDSLAGLVSKPNMFWLCWCLQPQSLPYHRDSCVRWMLSVPWEPQCLGTKHSSNIAKGSEVIRCLKGCICCISLYPFLSNGSKWYPFSAFRLLKEFNRQKPRQTSRILQPGNVLTWQVIIHELS